MITDPWFYATALVGTFLIGMSKSGFLIGAGMLGVPLMALTIPPVQAAAIQLPLLIATDWIGVLGYRKTYDRANLKILVPAAFIGTAAGWATASIVTDGMIRTLVGIIGVTFTLNYWLKREPPGGHAPTKASWGRGLFWGGLSTYTSFFAHAGGPPYAVYILPQRLPNLVYAGTTIMFYALINILKVPPYFMLGQFSSENLLTSAVLLPVAWASTMVGIWLVRRVPPGPFYRLAYATLFVISLKLLWDGAWQLWTTG
ncbi:MAG: sulfite exporter TauE/SafE family protein [Hyphomicrobiaceae bacterium]